MIEYENHGWINDDTDISNNKPNLKDKNIPYNKPKKTY